MAKHFLKVEDFGADELHLLLDESAGLKEVYRQGHHETCLTGKTAVLLFEKPSSRTRISFQVGMTQLGGSSVYIRPEDIGGLGQREPIADLTRVLNGYVDVIVARTFAHEAVTELAKYATVPVINALTDLAHPCQAMADMLTIREHCGTLEGCHLAYIGDANNVARSLAVASAALGVRFSIASPEGYAFEETFIARMQSKAGAGAVKAVTDPREAVEGADIVYTDTWTSMGQEAEKQRRIEAFSGYQVDSKLMSAAKAGAKVMHCLPAYRGLEVSDEVLESSQSIVFDQAENRLHFQRALLKYLCCS